MRPDDMLGDLEAAYVGLAPALGEHAREVAEFTAKKAAELADLVDDPDFDEALAAARDAIMLHGAASIVAVGDLADEANRRAVYGFLRIAAGAMASA